MTTPTKCLALALAAAFVPALGFAQQPPEEPTMEPATMEPAAMEAAPTMEPAATMEAGPAPTMEGATMEAPSAMTGPTAAELAERRERFRAAREARQAAAAEAAAAEAAAAEAAAAEAAAAEAAAAEAAAAELAPSADELALETPEAELEAMAAEENLEGEDFADEEPLDLAEEDADLLAAIEETEFEDAHEELHESGHGAEVTFGAIFSDRGWQASVITFTCLILLFWYFLFRKGKPVPKALEARRREIEEHLAEAQRLKAEAEAKKAEYAEKLEALDGQLESLRAEMVRAGEQERDRIVAEAESKAASIRRDVEFTIEQRMKQLREDLTGEMARAAVAAAEDVLREQTKPADQQRLAEHYLKSLADAAGSKETQA